MTYSFSNTPVYVSEGQTVRFKFKAPSTWNTTQSIKILIGEQETIWYITTIPEDFSPDPYPFTPIDGADTGVMYVYGDGTRPGEDIVEVSGLTPSTQASVTILGSLDGTVDNFSARFKLKSQGETVFGAWQLPNGNVSVENGDEIQVRLKSNDSPGLSSFVDLVIGARTERWTINTAVVPPNEPVPFPDFDDVTNAAIASNVYSNILQVQGLTDTAAITSSNTNLYVGVSNTNTYFTDADGYQVLSGVTFEQVISPLPTIVNGQYLQLRLQSSSAAGALLTQSLGIGDETDGSNWSVTTGNFPSTTPNSFSFTNKNDVLEDALIASNESPAISGLGTDVEVDVTLVSTNGTQPRVKVIYQEGGYSSIGLFPTKVNNGDKLVIYNKSSATFGATVNTQIKVGSRTITTWQITTNSGPDTEATYSIPTGLTNQVPNTQVVSSISTVTGINRPITISATNGALISVDFATPTSDDDSVTFDPAYNSSFRIFITTDSALSGQKQTTVTVGTGTNNSFTWQVSNYAVAPPPPDYRGAWYSKKNALVDSNGDIIENKEDGHSIGTVVPILKQPDGTYGDLEGTVAAGRLDARFPGYLECDGALHNASDYPELFDIIENTYGGDATYSSSTKTYSGQFRVPDLRNRKVVGTGVVDGNKASSAFLATDTSTLVEPGGTGGYWYVDDVDVSGYDPEAQNPYEIIIAGDQLAGALKTFELREQRTDTAIIPEGDRWVEKGLGEWVYRSAGGGYWPAEAAAGRPTSITQNFTMINRAGTGQQGTGMVLNITFEAIPNFATPPDENDDTRYRINSVVNPGQDYQVGDIVSCQFWDDIPTSGDQLVRVLSVYTGTEQDNTSNFFSLGTVKTVFNAPITAEIDFDITGSVVAQIGPLIDTLVTVPPHTHLYVSGVVDGITGDPLIQWNMRGMASLPSRARLPDPAQSNYVGSIGLDGSPLNNLNTFEDGVAKNDTDSVVALWMGRLNSEAPNFLAEWDRIDGVDDLETIIRNMIGNIDTKVYDGEEGEGSGRPQTSSRPADANMRVTETLVAETWWPSPYNRVSDDVFKSLGDGPASQYGTAAGSGGRGVLAVIDTNPKNVRVDAYTPTTLSLPSDSSSTNYYGNSTAGQTETHSHLITTQPVTDLTQDYSYGNVSSWGSDRKGLGSAQQSFNMTFNQSEVGMELNVGTFTLNTSIKKPIPTVAFSPNKKVELVPEFHKVKYIIKAY